MVHPDKHPIESYPMAHAYFNEIDQAYKSISTPLRRFIFKNYGPVCITIAENNPFMFIEYENADLSDPVVLNVAMPHM
jgi:DnaJ-class molecular chaperone